MRDIVSIDDENEGGLDYYTKNKKARKNKTSLLVDDFGPVNYKESNNTKGLSSWFGNNDKTNGNSQMNSIKPKNTRSVLVAEQMREKIKPNNKRPQTVAAAAAALSSTNEHSSKPKVKAAKEASKSNNSKQKKSLKDEVIEKRRARSEINNSLYEPPTLHKSGTTYDKEKTEKAIVKVIEKHKNSFHAKKEQNGERGFAVKVAENRLASETKRKKDSQKRTSNTHDKNNLSTIFED